MLKRLHLRQQFFKSSVWAFLYFYFKCSAPVGKRYIFRLKLRNSLLKFRVFLLETDNIIVNLRITRLEFLLKFRSWRHNSSGICIGSLGITFDAGSGILSLPPQTKTARTDVAVGRFAFYPLSLRRVANIAIFPEIISKNNGRRLTRCNSYSKEFLVQSPPHPALSGRDRRSTHLRRLRLPWAMSRDDSSPPSAKPGRTRRVNSRRMQRNTCGLAA